MDTSEVFFSFRNGKIIPELPEHAGMLLDAANDCPIIEHYVEKGVPRTKRNGVPITRLEELDTFRLNLFDWMYAIVENGGPTDELMQWLNGFSEKLRFIHILRKEKDGSVRWQTNISDISRGLSPDEIAAYLFSHHLALGNLDRVRRCQAEDCGKFFFGRKKAKWCSNACGSRHRVNKMRKGKE